MNILQEKVAFEIRRALTSLSNLAKRLDASEDEVAQALDALRRKDDYTGQRAGVIACLK